jgi:hypothetical protein
MFRPKRVVIRLYINPKSFKRFLFASCLKHSLFYNKFVGFDSVPIHLVFYALLYSLFSPPPPNGIIGWHVYTCDSLFWSPFGLVSTATYTFDLPEDAASCEPPRSSWECPVYCLSVLRLCSQHLAFVSNPKHGRLFDKPFKHTHSVQRSICKQRLSFLCLV